MYNDDKLEKLGNYFVHLGIQEEKGITFLQFISYVESGAWHFEKKLK